MADAIKFGMSFLFVSALYAAESWHSSDNALSIYARERQIEGIFTIYRPNAQDCSWSVNRWQRSWFGQAGWIVALAKGSSFRADVCDQLVIQIPALLHMKKEQPLAEYAHLLTASISEFNLAFVQEARKTMFCARTPYKKDSGIEELHVLMQYGKSLLHASGKREAGQTNFVPFVTVTAVEVGDDCEAVEAAIDNGPTIFIDIIKD